MIRHFSEESHILGRLIHHIHALYLELNLYSRLDDADKTVAVQGVIKSPNK